MALPCPRCRTAIPHEARFCPGCGSPVPEVDATAHAAAGGPGMEICAGCGVLAPYQGSACAVCGAAFAESRTRAAPRSDGAYWVAVRCRFQCRSCGHLSPLNHLDMDGGAVCLRCGLSQIFDVSSWRDGLAHAHAVGDLAGPEPEGRHPNPREPIAELNPFRDLGRSRTSAELAQSGMRVADGLVHTQSLRVDASPGQPLCDHCRRPLTVQLQSATRATARCVPCATSVTYELPPQAPAMCPSLKAVIAEDQAADRRDATIEQSVAGGAIAIRCPNCAAALTVTGSSQIVTCEFCRASARIPSRTLHELGFDHPEPLVWWLLFTGRSRHREQLEQAARDARQPPADAPAHLPRRARQRRARPAPHPLDPLLATALPLVITAAIGWLAFGDHVREWVRGVEAMRADDRGEWVALDGCSCESPTAQVELQLTEGGDARKPVLELALRLRTADATHALPSVTTRERRFGVGIACADDRVVLAYAQKVSAWSVATGERLWAAKLRKPYRYSGDAAASGIAAYCTTLATDGELVEIPRASKSVTVLRLSDGKRR